MCICGYNHMNGDPGTPLYESKKAKAIFGWPDPKEPGRTHGKDIMLLCKRWYNRDKYKDIKEALEEYYSERYQYGEKQDPLSFGFINEVLLKPAIQELLTDRFKHVFIDWIFSNHIRILETRKAGTVSYEESLYYRLIAFLANLQSLERDQSIIINTDDYYLMEDNERVKKDGHAVLAEPIIKD